MIRRWAELCPNVFMYDYTYIMLASAGTPVPLARKHLHDMPLLKKWGVIGFHDEGLCNDYLFIDGLSCGDQYTAHTLAHQGLMRPDRPGLPGALVPAVLTDAGRVIVADAERAAA